MAPPETAVSLKELNTKKFSKSIKYLLVIPETEELKEAKLQFIEGDIIFLDVMTDELLWKLKFESIGSWRRGRVAKDLRQKIESTWIGIDKANLDQIVMCLNSGEIFRILGDVSSLQEKIERIFQRLGFNFKQEYECMIWEKKK